jgi:hypothetical protein
LWDLANVPTAIGDLESDIIAVTPKDESSGMKDYATNFDIDYEERLKQYTGVVKAIEANPEAYKGVTVEKPLKPTKLVPYKGDFFDLDKARRDCRFEMIKIVREVMCLCFSPILSSC